LSACAGHSNANLRRFAAENLCRCPPHDFDLFTAATYWLAYFAGRLTLGGPIFRCPTSVKKSDSRRRVQFKLMCPNLLDEQPKNLGGDVCQIHW